MLPVFMGSFLCGLFLMPYKILPKTAVFPLVRSLLRSRSYLSYTKKKNFVFLKLANFIQISQGGHSKVEKPVREDGKTLRSCAAITLH